MPNHRSRNADRVCRNALLAVLFGAIVASCGQGDQPAAPKGQVIAQIGKDDVTKQELDNEFRWLGIPVDRRDDAAVKRVLGDLIQRKYLVQKAIEAKLDREPTNLLDMIRAREQVLATSYIQRDVTSKSTAIGKSDIDKYILGHPMMFDKRQILTVDRVTIPLTPNAKAAVDASKNAKSLEEVEQKLKEVGMLYNRSMGVISSADFPEDFIKTLSAQKADDVFFLASGQSGIFFKVRRQETSPVSGEDAAKLARQHLLRDLLRTETGKQAVSAEADAKYQGDYARIMRGQPADAKKQ